MYPFFTTSRLTTASVYALSRGFYAVRIGHENVILVGESYAFRCTPMLADTSDTEPLKAFINVRQSVNSSSHPTAAAAAA